MTGPSTPPGAAPDGDLVRRSFLFLLLAATTAAFVWMVRPFLLTALVAAIAAGLLQPVHLRLRARLGGRDVPAALATIVLFLVLIFVPLLAVLGAVAAEAVQVSETIGPRLMAVVEDPGAVAAWLRELPGYALVAPYEGAIVARAGDLIGGAGAFLSRAVSATTQATASFVFLFVVMLYTLFFFLVDGPRLLAAVLAYLPLAERDTRRLLDLFLSVTRATLKGTLLIACIQGTLGGLAFWALGISGALFWGAVMTVASVVPGIGSVIVWLPTALGLLVTGRVWQGLALVAVGALVIGTVDNVLRPRLVGRDTKMHELLIFFSTLGGISLFGAAGFLLGPILAALFLALWQLFGAAAAPRPSGP